MAECDGRDGVGRNPGREVDADMVVGLQRRWTDVLKHSEEPQWSTTRLDEVLVSRCFDLVVLSKRTE